MILFYRTCLLNVQYILLLYHVKLFCSLRNTIVYLCRSSVLGLFVVHAAINKRTIVVMIPKSPCLSHIDNAAFEPMARKISITVYLLNLIINNLPMKLCLRNFYHFLFRKNIVLPSGMQSSFISITLHVSTLYYEYLFLLDQRNGE